MAKILLKDNQYMLYFSLCKIQASVKFIAIYGVISHFIICKYYYNFVKQLKLYKFYGIIY